MSVGSGTRERVRGTGGPGPLGSAGRVLVSGAAVVTALGPAWAELNASRAFNPLWTPHARFHSVVTVQTNALAGLAALWLLWRDPRPARAPRGPASTGPPPQPGCAH